MFEPMNPAPPVTTTRTVSSPSSAWRRVDDEITVDAAECQQIGAQDLGPRGHATRRAGPTGRSASAR